MRRLGIGPSWPAFQTGAMTTLALCACIRDPCETRTRFAGLKVQPPTHGKNGPWRPVGESNACWPVESRPSWATRRTGRGGSPPLARFTPEPDDGVAPS